MAYFDRKTVTERAPEPRRYTHYISVGFSVESHNVEEPELDELIAGLCLRCEELTHHDSEQWAREAFELVDVETEDGEPCRG